MLKKSGMIIVFGLINIKLYSFTNFNLIVKSNLNFFCRNISNYRYNKIFFLGVTVNKLGLLEQTKVQIVYKSDISGDMMVLATYIAFWVLIFGYMFFIHTKIKKLEKKTDSIN